MCRHLSLALSNKDMECILSFLDAAPALTGFFLSSCEADSIFAANVGNLVSALQRNNRIETLGLLGCPANVTGPILQALFSQLTKLVYSPPKRSVDEWSRSAGALQQYLESPTAIIQCFKFHHFRFVDKHSGSSQILQSLTQCASVSIVEFEDCRFYEPTCPARRMFIDVNDEDVAEDIQQVSNFVKNKLNLETLRFLKDCGKLLESQTFQSAVAEVVSRRRTCLKCLEITITLPELDHGLKIPSTEFEVLIDAAASSTSQLEHLILWYMYQDEWHNPYFHKLPEVTPGLKTKKISLIFLNQPIQDYEGLMLAALKNNYVVQQVECVVRPGGPNWFSNENQALLDSYLHCNQKLAQWREDPKLVPRDLWSYAVMLALKASINPLYQSLIELSGQDIGVQEGRRKRKPPQCYDPSLNAKKNKCKSRGRKCVATV